MGPRDQAPRLHTPLLSEPSHLINSSTDREITGNNNKYSRPGLETTFYDINYVRVIDPFGNRIRFNQGLKPAKAT